MGWLFFLATPIVALGPEPDKTAPVPARQHLLTIEGENDITFAPAAGLNSSKLEYRARIEYVVKTRTGDELEGDAGTTSKKKTKSKATRTARKAKKAEVDDEPPPTVASAVDIAIHAAEMDFLQNGQTVVQSRISRSRFQGRFSPDAGLEPRLSGSTPSAPGSAETLRRHGRLGVA